MEDTRHAIRRGRLLADEGLHAAAVETWKAALSGAYSLQDYAGAFVLSCNVGGACVRLAAQETDGERAATLLREAREHLDYALQLVEQCSLRSVLGGYRALYRGVRRAETLRRKAEKLLQELQAEKEGKKETCTTCGQVGEVVLDENDGCCYCRQCYDEYYAAVRAGEAASGVFGGGEDEVVAVDVPSAESGGSVDVGDDDEVFAVDVASAVEVSGDMDDSATDDDPAIVVALTQTVSTVPSTTAEVSVSSGIGAGGKSQDRIRYERVELGSLADLLAGKVHIEDRAHPLEMHHENVDSYTTEPLTTAIIPEVSHTEEPLDQEESVAAAVDDCSGESGEAKSPTSDSAREEDPRSDEDAAAVAIATTGKHQYSIAELLELRKQSPTVCPDSLFASPVRDDGTTIARQKNTNLRKKSNAKKAAR
ncbi:unnamed protein product [Phytophthora lilii]|uniref:Unnamed protein product n=1 Tax=Phytophthora lilii TaxID=2077276 RepID=A0A9W6U276_9STRA|nr:unnamed protein product [Phytophthora lilii]